MIVGWLIMATRDAPGGGDGQIGGERRSELVGLQVQVGAGGAVRVGVGHLVHRGQDLGAGVLVDQYAELLALVGDERGDVDQRLDVGVAGGGVGDDGAALGVADQDDRALDRGRW